MTPTERLRARVIDYLGGRWDGDKRTLRSAAAETGVAYNTIARFVRGRPISSDVFDRLDAALAASPQSPEPAEPTVTEALCDRIVNNGFGEPTECGRTLPCEYHDAPAAEPQPSVAASPQSPEPTPSPERSDG